MTHHGYAVAAKTGAHAAVVEYASTLNEPGVEPFDRMRRNRNRSEYGTREFSESEVQADTDKAELIVTRIGELLAATK